MATRIARSLIAALSACALLAFAPPANAQPRYSIVVIDAPACAATAVNDLGAVVGDCGAGGSLDSTAFLWQGGVVTSLGKLRRANYSQAHAINTNGIAVGEGDTGDFRPHPTLYRNGTIIDVDSSVANGRAIYVNDKGVIVGNALKGFSGSSGWSAVIWKERPDKPGRFDRLSLQPYPGGDANVRFGYATGANQSLQVVGWVQNSLFGQLGAFWDSDANHTLSLLQPLSGDWTTIAEGVNDLGQAVGESHGPSRGRRAVLWLDDAAHTPVDLGTLPGDVESFATGINNQAQVIGMSLSADGTSRSFLWQNGQMAEVGSLLDESGAGWVIENVAAINGRGQIVGTGLYQGQFSSFLMTPEGL